MDDQSIVALYLDRNEDALVETEKAYGSLLLRLAERILPRREDAEEVVSDTLLDAWQAIPPHRPEALMPFLGKILRRRAIDRLRREKAEKRGGSEMILALEEWDESLAGRHDPQKELEGQELARAVNAFVYQLKEPGRDIFIRRYWFLDTIPEIAARHRSSVGRISMILARSRKKLLEHLEKKEWIS